MMISRYRSSMFVSLPKDLLYLVNPLHQPVDLFRGGIEIKAGPRGGLDAELLMQRLGAVMPGAHGDTVPVEDLGDIVRVDVVQGEGRHPALLRCGRTENLQPGDLFQAIER